MNQIGKYVRTMERLRAEAASINERLNKILRFNGSDGKPIAYVTAEGAIELFGRKIRGDEVRHFGEWLIAITHDPEPPFEVAGQDVPRG